MMPSPAICSTQEIYHTHIFNDNRTEYDKKYKDVTADLTYLKTIFYSNYLNRLDTLFHEFIAENNEITENQISVLNRTLSYLQSFVSQNYILINDIKIDMAVDAEVLVYRKSVKGLYNIVIDTDGDVMTSFSGYKEKGWRNFYDKDEFKPSAHINDFFSI